MSFKTNLVIITSASSSPSQASVTGFTVPKTVVALGWMQSEMLLAFAPQFTVHLKKSPKPGLKISFVTALTLFPHPSKLQIRGKLAFIDLLSATLNDSSPSWISNLPAHFPGPSTSFTPKLSVPQQQGENLKIGPHSVQTTIERHLLDHRCALPAHVTATMWLQGKGFFSPLCFAMQCHSEDSLPAHSTWSNMPSCWSDNIFWLMTA